MKNSILLYLLLFTAMAGAQVISIPDAALKNKLVTSAPDYNMVAADSSGDFIFADANGDGEIDQDEADDIRELYLQNSGIASLEGLQYFSNLRVLYVQYNSLTAFNAAAVTDLRELNCAHNQLTSLTVAGLDHLEILMCNNNQLSALAFTGMEYLVSVNCSFNNISQLDFSDCPQFNALSCSSNNITYLNLKNGALQDGGATNNWTGNAGLAYVCIDEDEAAIVNNLLATGGYTNATANSFCSFTPGGNYNTIDGTLTFDDEGNGCDSGDFSQKFVKVGATAGAESCSAFTDALGHYEFYMLEGNFTIVPQFEESYYTASPSTGSVNFPPGVYSQQTVDFCIAPAGVNPDIEIVMEPIIPPVPGQDAIYKMVYKNKGSQVLNGSVNCTWDFSRFNFYTNSFMPYATDMQFNGNMATYIWDYTNLQPFESREVLITLGVHTPTDAVPVTVGDVLTFDAAASATGDVLPADNNHTLSQEAVASYSGNSITCIEGTAAPVTAIGEYMHYVVRYTNEGTGMVSNVVIENDFDPAQFDVSSIQILNSSQPVTASVTGNRLRISVQSANLSATGGGNILFKAKSKSNLVQGAAINSQARIFYDYSAPVDTNTATTVFNIMGTDTPVLDNSVKVYPNPANSLINISVAGQLQSVQLYDIQGRLLQTVLVNDTTATLDVSGRAAGIYFVKVTTDKGLKVEKIVKE
ncbi:MAG: T9SS type A sorting domain-containing protein [Bacteroidota bacterium]